MKSYFALIATETTGIIVALVIALIWKSWFMALWLIPLVLKLTSAFLTVDRHPLEIPSILLPQKAYPHQPSQGPGSKDQGAQENKSGHHMLLQQKKFEIHGLPHGFLILEGNEELILQFFRHYGHPVRNLLREYAQLTIILLFGFVFPAGLLCSMLWMPLGMQYVWMAYQMYTIFTMHVYRYARGKTWASTEERLAAGFVAAAAQGQPMKTFLGGEQGVVMAELETTYHSRYREGRKHCDQLLSLGRKYEQAGDLAEKHS